MVYRCVIGCWSLTTTPESGGSHWQKPAALVQQGPVDTAHTWTDFDPVLYGVEAAATLAENRSV